MEGASLGDTVMGTWEALGAQFRTMSVETIHQPNNVTERRVRAREEFRFGV